MPRTYTESLEASWEQEVRRSGVIILNNGDAYLKEVGVSVWTILHQLSTQGGERQLQLAYPGLTPDDLRACMLFGYLRSVHRL